MTETAFFPPPIPNDQLDALVAAATPQELRRALRIVLGAEQAAEIVVHAAQLAE